MNNRHLSFIDQLICGADRALRTLTPGTQSHKRPSPVSADHNTNDIADAKQRKHAAGLMRVNHTGEVCAQALYQGQALTAKLPEVRTEMETAADEEIDHLAWCEQRLNELDSKPSILNPVWYSLSFGIGATAGLISDKVSLGFVAATEEQVCKHLQEHLEALPENDQRSRKIVTQMLQDEEKHAHTAIKAGGIKFLSPIKRAMSLASRAMTSSSYRI